jgi:hypothetical protein
MIGNFIILSIVFLFILVKKYELIPFMFILFLPMSNIFGETANILGVLGYHEILSIGVIFHYFMLRDKKLPSNKFTNQISNLLFAYLLVAFYVYFKEMFFEFSAFDYSTIFKRLVKAILEYTAIVIIIRSINRNNYKLFLWAVLIGTLFLAFAGSYSYFSDSLLITRSADGRITGIITGNPNEFAAILAISMGFLLYLIENKRSKLKTIYIIGFVISFIAVLLTGSRTGFFSVIIILFIYFYRNFTLRNSLFIFLFIIILIGIFYVNGGLVLERLFSLEEYVGSNIKEEARVQKWGIYLKHIIDNPRFLIYGSESNAYHRAAHNIFISSIHDAGIIISLFLLTVYWKFIKTSVKEMEFAYVFLPFLFASIMGSSALYYYYYVFAFPIIGFIKSNKL